MRLLLALGWIAVGLCPLAYAQVRVAARVTNENNLPVAGARVTLTDIPSTKTWNEVSDPTGTALLQLPAPGAYSLKVDREGFYVVSEPRVTVPVTPPDEPPFELHISLQSIHDLRSTVEVKADPGFSDMDRVTPQTTLSSRTLYDVPFPNPNNLRSGLRLIPGVVQDSVGGIHLYGGSEDQAQYSFEGFQLNDPLTGRFDARMSLEAVQSVDVQSSPADAEMGRGEAGAMLLHARTGGDSFKFAATAIFPSIDLGTGLRIMRWTPRSSFSGPWRKKHAWFFNTAELQFIRAVVPPLSANQNSATGWRVNDLLHNQFNLSEKNILFIGILFDFQYAPHSGLTLLDPLSTTLKREADQWFGYVKDQNSFSRSSMLEFGFAASLTHATATPQGDAPYLITPDGRLGDYYATSRQDAQRLQGIANYYLPAFHFLGEHQFKVGADFVDLEYQQDVTRTAIDYLDDSAAIVRSIGFTGSGRLSSHNYQGAFYLQDSWRVRPWLLVELGLRADEDRLDRMSSSPRAGFAISPPKIGMRISGSFARIVAPTDLQLFTRPLDQSAVSTYFNDAGSLIYGPVSSDFTLGPKLHNPHSDVWTLGVERALPKRVEASLQLLRRRSTSGFDYTNNLPAADQLPAILAGAPNPGPVTADYILTNQRQDQYDSVEAGLRQFFRGRFEWMVSYTHSLAESNAVIERTVDQPLSVSSDTGPLPWDAPNRLLSWGYLPTISKSWAFAYLLDWHTGLPFSIQDPYGQLVGAVDDRRFPVFFELNLFVERILSVRGYRLAVRGGLNNITGHFNPTVVDNVAGGSTYLREYGGQARAVNFELRYLGRRQ